MPSDPGKLRQKRVPIPEPPALPFLGHLAQFKSEDSVTDMMRFHDKYGEIFRLRFPEGKPFLVAGSHKLVNELCDETRFQKAIDNTELIEVRNAVDDGLFTARPEEPSWGVAHRILMPAFGPIGIRAMFDEMYDVMTQLALKWARQGPDQHILAADDFTRLAFDTIGLCSMGFRFNSFYRNAEQHPFVDSMASVLTESGQRFQRPAIAKPFTRGKTNKYFKDIQLLRNTAEEIIQERKADPDNKRKDLLAAMMNGVDARDRAKMTDESIINNLITFLIAGHETTSGTLSFLFYSLLKNPEAYQKAQQEVDKVIGRGPITVDNIFKLKYLTAALRETLRMCSPITGIAVEALEDTYLDDKYFVTKGETIVAFYARSHLDPQVYGEDANTFQPERMLDDNFDRLQKEFPNCWKPFGNGVRACIGRPFAWQEMLLACTVLLQNFNFSMADPGYNLRLLETLTIKPKDFYIKVALRHCMSALELEHQLRGIPTAAIQKPDATVPNGVLGKSVLKPMTILYGSNSGTCEALARRLAADAEDHCYSVSKVDTLDSAKENLPTDQPVIIVTSSYEGEPPDNAAQFVSWVKHLESPALSKVSYAIFAVGNREWAHTFHRIPKFLDSQLERVGATRFIPMGSTDVSQADPFTEFDAWQDDVLWPSLQQHVDVAKDASPSQSGLTVHVSAPRVSMLKQNLNEATVTSVRDLSAPGVPLRKHIEVRLPEGTTYRAGDYLCVLPINPRENVSRVFRHFGISWDATLTIAGKWHVAIPQGQAISAWDILSSYLELSQPATKKNIRVLRSHTVDEKTQMELDELSENEFQKEVTAKRVSVMDLLERFPMIELSLASYLSMLPAIRTRQYSIASSPLKNPHHVSIAYSVLNEPALAGQGQHLGVATSFLSTLNAKDVIHAKVWQSREAFHLPLTPESTPIICVAAGTGIGPFRGFVEERAEQIASGRTLAPALLFLGCRGKADDLYREEFDCWEKRGVVIVKRAYSREESLETMGCKYAQDRMMMEKSLICKLWDDGAKMFICGSPALGKAVEETCVEILMDASDVTKEEAQAFIEGVRSVRIVSDVYT